MIRGVSHITFSVSNLERSVRFYRDGLGMTLAAIWDHGAYLLAGETWIALNVDPNVRVGPLPEYSHVAFSIPQADLDDLMKRIERAGGTPWRPSRKRESFYFLDPDGHKLELHSGDLAGRLAQFSDDPPDGFRPPQIQRHTS